MIRVFQPKGKVILNLAPLRVCHCGNVIAHCPKALGASGAGCCSDTSPAIPVPHSPRVKAPDPETVLDQARNAIHPQF